MTILTCFIYTLYHYYACYGTNLLTRCQTASSCFLLFLVSEILHRKYSRNWTKQKPTVYFPRSLPEVRRGDEEEPRWPHTTWRRSQEGGRAALWGGPLERLPTLPLRLYNPSVAKTLVPRATIREKLLRRRRRQPHLGGF